MELEEPDILPISEQSIDPSVRNEILGEPEGRVSPSTVFQSEEEKRLRLLSRNVQANVSAHVKADLDAIWVGTGAPTNCKPPTWLSENVYMNNLGQIYEIKKDIGITWYRTGTVESLDDWEKFRYNLDPYAPGIMDRFVETVNLARAHELCIIGTLACGALTNAYLTCGLSTALLNFYKEPKFVYKVMEDFTIYLTEIAKQMADLGADVFCIGDDLADCKGPLISPAMLRKYVFPLLKHVNDEVKKRGMLIFLHSDGNLYPILDDIVDVGYDGIQAIEPQAGMDIGVVKERYGDKLFLMGNVDCSHTLCFGSISDVQRETREVIRKASPGGGHILSSSNSIHNAVRAGNFVAMIRTARKYGRYARH